MQYNLFIAIDVEKNLFYIDFSKVFFLSMMHAYISKCEFTYEKHLLHFGRYFQIQL